MKNTLLIVLYSGEQEYQACLEAIRNQRYSNFDVKVIEGLSNVSAHNALYETIMRESNNYRFFVKCDADMVFKSSDALAQIERYFEKHPNINHLCFSVLDWFSDKEIMGLHAFRNDVKWSLPIKGIFLDPDPINSKKLSLAHEPPAPIASHANNPSDFQAFYFGMHRTIKALRVRESKFNLKTSISHFLVLRSLQKKYLRNKDRRLGLSLLGMSHVITNHIDNLELVKSDYESHFDAYRKLTDPALEDSVSRAIPKSFLGWILMYVRTVGPVRIFKALSETLLRKLKS